MLVRGVLSNWTALVVNALIALILTPILIRTLGPLHYGMWVLVASVVDYFGVLDVGMRTTLQRFVARLTGADDRRALEETLATALALTLAVSGLLVVLTGGLAMALPDFFRLGTPDRRPFQLLVLLLGLNVAATLPLRLLGACLCGLHRFDLYNLTGVAQSLVRALLFVALLGLGHGAVTLAAVTLSVTLAGLPFTQVLLTFADRGFRWRIRAASRARARELVQFSFYLALTTVGDYLRSYTHSIVIGRLLGVALITDFHIATRFTEYMRALVVAVLGPAMPAMSALEGQARRAELRRFFLRATTVTALFSSLLASLLILNGRLVIRLWVGAEFEPSYRLALVLLAGSVVANALGPCTVLLVALGRHRALGLWTLGEGLANLALSIYWAPTYGLMGVAFATAVPMLAVRLLIQPAYTLRVIQLPIGDYFVGALIRPLGVAALVIATSALLPDATPTTLLQLLAAVTWQTSLFLLLGYCIGMGPDDRGGLRDRVRALLLSARAARPMEKAGCRTSSPGSTGTVRRLRPPS